MRKQQTEKKQGGGERQQPHCGRGAQSEIQKGTGTGCTGAVFGVRAFIIKDEKRMMKQLKKDTSIDVRKSVANNLNDISKTHPDLVMGIAKDWYGENEITNLIVKHGCRTLLKKGNPHALALFGYDNSDSIDVQDFVLNTLAICIGEDIVFPLRFWQRIPQK